MTDRLIRVIYGSTLGQVIYSRVIRIFHPPSGIKQNVLAGAQSHQSPAIDNTDLAGHCSLSLTRKHLNNLNPDHFISTKLQSTVGFHC